MIIFDLDGTLADCEHRKHFIDITKSLNHGYLPAVDVFGSSINDEQRGYFYHKVTKDKWKPNWDAFFDACDKDTAIIPVLDTFIHLTQGEPFNHDVEIWSGRCESVREKTLNWLTNLSGYMEDNAYWNRRLKMRLIGDYTPDDQLKEKWLDESISEGKKIDFVFDDRPKVVRMWRRRGIFVFNCNQTDQEF